MTDAFFDKPILNSPYGYPARHWELDASGQPTHRIIPARRRAEFITPIPKPRKQKGGNRTEVLQALARSKPILAGRYGLTSLALFGSVARGAARADSDIDILVSFDGPATSQRYFGVQFFLEDLLGRPVDLVTDKALRAELRPFVEHEAIHV